MKTLTKTLIMILFAVTLLAACSDDTTSDTTEPDNEAADPEVEGTNEEDAEGEGQEDEHDYDTLVGFFNEWSHTPVKDYDADKWDEIDSNVTISEPIFVEDDVTYVYYHNGRQNLLEAHREDQDEAVWSVQESVSPKAPSLMVDELLLMGGGEAIYAFEKEDGSIRYEIDLEEYTDLSKLLVAGDYLGFVAVHKDDEQTMLFVYDVLSGEEQWSKEINTKEIARFQYELAAYEDEIVYDIVNEDKLQAFDMQDGELLWETEVPYLQYQQAFVDGERVYIIDEAFVIYGYDAMSGEEVMTYQADILDSYISTTVPSLFFDELAILVDIDEEHVFGIDLAEEQELWRLDGKGYAVFGVEHIDDALYILANENPHAEGASEEAEEEKTYVFKVDPHTGEKIEKIQLEQKMNNGRGTTRSPNAYYRHGDRIFLYEGKQVYYIQ